MRNRDQPVQSLLSQLRASAGRESGHWPVDFVSGRSVEFLYRFHDLFCLSRGEIRRAVGSGLFADL